MAIQRPKLKFVRGTTYTLDLSHSSMATHPIRFTADSGVSEYTHGVTVTGTEGQAGATVSWNVPDSAPDNMMYYCTTHGIGMGNKISVINDAAAVNYIGSRGWNTGGNTSASSTKAGSNNITYFSIPTQSTATRVNNVFSDYGGGLGLQATGTRGADCLVVGGNASGNAAFQGINKFNCVTLGAATSHGTLTAWLGLNSDTYYSYDNDTNQNWMNRGSMSDGDRCVFQAGYYHAGNNGVGSFHADIGYVSIQNSGNANNHGDLTQARRGPIAANDDTRGLFIAGENVATSGTNRIDYVTIQTPGDATDFGDYTYNLRRGAGTHNKTIALTTGGRYDTGSPSTLYITYSGQNVIQTLGNATSFGNLNTGRNRHGCVSDGTYAVSYGGVNASGDVNVYEYQSFATPGNGVAFGTLGTLHVQDHGTGSGAAA